MVKIKKKWKHPSPKEVKFNVDKAARVDQGLVGSLLFSLALSLYRTQMKQNCWKSKKL